GLADNPADSSAERLEALRQLVQLYQPASKTRSLGILSALTSMGHFRAGEPLLPQVLDMERIMDEYERSSSKKLDDDFKAIIFLRSVSNNMRNHLATVLSEDVTYNTLRETALHFERMNTRWDSKNLFAGDSLFPKGRASQEGPVPMEVDALQRKGKKGNKGGKGKGDKGGKSSGGKSSKGGKGKGDKGGKSAGGKSSKGGKGKGDKGSGGKGDKRNVHRVELAVEIDMTSDDVPQDSPYVVCAVTSGIGRPGGTDSQWYRDAQGRRIAGREMRTATIEIGGVKFREQWLLSSVTQPLFCVGKLMRKNGWDIIHDGAKVPYLTSPDGSTRVPLFYKNYSLHARGSIRGVFGQDNITEPAIRALEVTGPWLELNDAFHEVAPQVYARRDNTDCFLDCGDALAHLGVQCRTTVRQDSLGWNVVEFNQDVTLLEQPEAEFEPRRIHQTITIGCVGKVEIDALFNRKPRHVPPAPDDDAMLDDGLPALPEECAGDAIDQDELLAGIDDAVNAEAEAAAGEQQSRQGHIVVDGVELHEGCNLKTIRAACQALGVGKSGGKSTLLARIASHLDKQRLLEKHQVEYDSIASRQQPREQRPVETPTPEQVRLHSLSHIPFAPWCEHCLKFQARADKHTKARPETRECSVCAFDYCFTERPTGDRGQKLICLVAKDSHTGAAIAIPTPAKGGAVPFRFLVAELCKFINFCGHSEITLRSDGEATCRALQQGVKDLRTKLKLVTHLEQTEKEDHQGNPAEQAVDQLRQLTGTLLLPQQYDAKFLESLRDQPWSQASFLAGQSGQTRLQKTFQGQSDQAAEEAPAPEVVEDEGPQPMPYPGHVVADDTLLSDLVPPPPLLRTPEPPTPSNPSAVAPAHMLPSLTPVPPETASPVPMLVEPSASAGGDESTAAGGDSAPTPEGSTGSLPTSGTVRARPADAPADAHVPPRTKRLRLDAVQASAHDAEMFHHDEPPELFDEAAEEFLDCEIEQPQDWDDAEA
ncbi:unnamed protein product, partial [Symbiodinium sp. CCMP2456]